MEIQNERQLTVSDSAAEKIKTMALNESESRRHLRIHIKGMSKSGWIYKLGFDGERQGDNVIFTNGITVLIDGRSALYIEEATLDIESGPGGETFVLLNRKSMEVETGAGGCGCGKPSGCCN